MRSTSSNALLKPPAATSSGREFSPVKLTILLYFILKYEIRDSSPSVPMYETYFERDLNYCKSCFRNDVARCNGFFENLEPSGSHNPMDVFLYLLSLVNSKRIIQYYKLRNSDDESPALVTVAKYLSQSKLDALTPVPDITSLRHAFEDKERVDGFQFCPQHDTQRFVRYFKTHSQLDALTIWLYMVLNVQLLLLPELWQRNFPVPKVYAVCGFTQFQSYAGASLVSFYNAEFPLKLRISRQLLKAANKFTRGFDGFRIYITDMSADNIVYNTELDELYFIDLDTVLIADSKSSIAGDDRTEHKHIHIECDNCFAYAPSDICSHQRSDFNIYAACQFLREDLTSNKLKGFLTPIPRSIIEDYPEITKLLNRCVDCLENDCKSRFAASVDLIKLFDKMLQ